MKQRVKKAFVLAAGYGTRMLPLTRTIPKPLLPLWGVPLIDRTLELVRSWGVEDVVVNVHHGADAIVRHLVQNPLDGLRIQVSFEPEILGTGGALTKASWFFSDGKPFWMVNADIAAKVDIAPIIRAFKPGKTISSSWLMASKGPRTVECSKGLITNFKSSRAGTDGTYTFCGVHLVDPRIVKFLPANGFASIIDAYEKAIKRGWNIAGVPIENAWWSDLGTPTQYLEAHKETTKRKKNDIAAISQSACVKNGAVLKNCVVLDGAIIGPRVRAEQMIFGPDVRVSKCSGVMTMRAVDALDHDEQRLVKLWAGKLEHVVASALAPRGSSRIFTRVYSGRQSAILVRHNPERRENNLYAAHAKFLASLNIPVPGVIQEDKRNNISLYEDVGVDSVQDLASRWKSEKLESLYKEVLDAMVVFHEDGGRVARRKKLPLMPAFTSQLYSWEHALFTELFLKDRMGINRSVINAVKKELGGVSRRLLKLPRVLLHRDLQSSNIILKGRQWSLIDFQGMRFGPAVYDLASLLCDPYIKINRAVRKRLLYYYTQKAGAASACSDELFGYAVIQRLTQALGAYARFGKNPATSHFTGYIRPALLNVKQALKNIENSPALEDVVSECLNREK